MHLWIKKMNLFSFTHTVKQNSPSGFFINLLQAEYFENWTFLLEEEETMRELKKWPKLNL